MSTVSTLIPCSFTTLRYVPNILTGEFLNIGIFMQKGFDSKVVLERTYNLRMCGKIMGISDISTLKIALEFLESSLERSPVTLRELLDINPTGILQFGEQLGGLFEDPHKALREEYKTYVRKELRYNNESLYLNV